MGATNPNACVPTMQKLLDNATVPELDVIKACATSENNACQEIMDQTAPLLVWDRVHTLMLLSPSCRGFLMLLSTAVVWPWVLFPTSAVLTVETKDQQHSSLVFLPQSSSPNPSLSQSFRVRACRLPRISCWWLPWQPRPSWRPVRGRGDKAPLPCRHQALGASSTCSWSFRWHDA